MSRVKKLLETIRSLIEGEFSGYIKINFSQGSLGRVEQSEELDETLTRPRGRRGKNQSEDKDFFYENANEIGNSTDMQDHFGQVARSENDRRSGNNHYAGLERRCGVDRRSYTDRRSCRKGNGQVPDINQKRQSGTKDLTDNKKQKNALQQRLGGTEKPDAK